MTILPFYEPRILEMRLEKYAEIAIDGGLWSVGEVLAQDLPMKHGFAPDPCYVYKPRHLQAAITELCRINEELRHRIFIAGFLTLPDNGAQATFRRLLATHAQMLNEAFRIEWRRRYSEVIDVSEPLRSTVTVTKEMLHSPKALVSIKFVVGEEHISMARQHLQALDAISAEVVNKPRNVLIYIRVSTEKQSNNQLSLDSQEEHLIARCKRDGDNIAGIFREEGETATNMRRPAFEQMIARATDGMRTIDAIMVYSFSRAFRNQVEQELTVQTLRKHKVELISHAEPLANDDTGDMFRKFIGIVNEYQSKETSRSTMRTMKANAKLGYSNGGIIPFGYKSVDAEVIGNKQKKKLAIEPVEAETVIRAFDLAKNGDGSSGPLGTKKIAEWLNERGYRSRNGSLFGTGTIHEILTRRAYTGVRNFNEFARKSDGERKAQSEIVEYEIPAIIDQATFDAVQALLVSRHPRSRGPRLSAAPSLLGGLVRCDCEQSCSLTTATGTSRTGVIYSYYKCVQAIKQGRHKEGNGATCANRKIPRPVVEKLVVDALLDQLIQPERVTSILLALKERRDERQASADRRIVDLARQAFEAEERLGRLYAAIEAGTIDGTDPSLKERVAALKNARDRAVEAADYARKSSALPVQIDPVAIDRFTRLMREQLVSGDVAARKAYLASIVDAVIVSENKIRIMGSNDNIRSTFGPKGQPMPVVRKSVQEWCAI